MDKIVYENEVITQTVVGGNVLTGVSIGTLQEDFFLSEADFLRLKGQGSAYVTCSFNMLFATIGYAISVLPKWLSELSGKPEKVSQSEWTAMAIGLLLTLVLYFMNKIMPNEKKELLNKISLHFKSAPKSRQIVKGQR